MKNVALMTVFNTIQWWYTWQWLTFFGQPVYILGKIRQVIVVIYNLKHETCTVPLLRDCTLHDIFRAIVVSRILYAAPAWLGTWECVHHQLIVAVLTRFCVAANASATGTVATTCLLSLSCLTLLTMLFFQPHQDQLQSRTIHPYLPDKLNLPYQLRIGSHNKTLINKTKLLNSSDFIVCMLYKYSY